MNDLYIFIENGINEPDREESEPIVETREAAIARFLKCAQFDETCTLKVIKANPEDNTCYFVTDDIAEAAFDAWKEGVWFWPDADIPRAFTELGFERGTPTSNRENRTYTANGGYPAA